MSTTEFDRLLAGALRHSVPEPLRTVRAAVVFDAGEGMVRTVLLRDGELRLTATVVDRPDSTIRADLVTLRAMARGELTGIDAFLTRRLTVRGNLALAMQLQCILGGKTRPKEFPRHGLVGGPGRRTHYLEAGPPAGPPIVLLHGLGATNASLLPLVSELATDHRVIAPDLPGFGGSDVPRGRYDARFFATWLDGVLDELGVQRSVVAGNSLGGRIALEVALRLPDRVRGVVGLAPAMAFRKLRQLVPLVSIAPAELALAPVPVPRRLVHRSVRRLFAKPHRLPDTWYDAAVDEFCRVMSRPANRVAFIAAARHIYLEAPFGENGMWTRLSSLGIPALFVWGARDRLVPAGFARHVRAALPASRSVVLTDCGHVPQFEQPERVIRLVREFLAELEAGEAGLPQRDGRAG